MPGDALKAAFTLPVMGPDTGAPNVVGWVLIAQAVVLGAASAVAMFAPTKLMPHVSGALGGSHALAMLRVAGAAAFLVSYLYGEAGRASSAPFAAASAVFNCAYALPMYLIAFFAYVDGMCLWLAAGSALFASASMLGLWMGGALAKGPARLLGLGPLTDRPLSATHKFIQVQGITYLMIGLVLTWMPRNVSSVIWHLFHEGPIQRAELALMQLLGTFIAQIAIFFTHAARENTPFISSVTILDRLLMIPPLLTAALVFWDARVSLMAASLVLDPALAVATLVVWVREDEAEKSATSHRPMTAAARSRLVE